MSSPNKTREKKYSFLKRYITKKVVAGIMVVLALGVLGVGVGKVISMDSKTTKIGFEDIGELATQSVSCTEVNVTEASRDLWGITIPFTQSKYIYSYDVEIKAGFDFKEIEWSENEEKSTIEVKLPEVKILSTEINMDSFKLYHEEESIFRPITMEENNKALSDLKQKAEDDAVANGLLENARSNAETILKGFFSNEYDLSKYEIKFTDK